MFNDDDEKRSITVQTEALHQNGQSFDTEKVRKLANDAFRQDSGRSCGREGLHAEV